MAGIGASIYSIVYNLRIDGSLGSCFRMQKGDVVYLVSAKHVLNETALTRELGIEESWVPIEGETILHPSERVDIGAIRLESPKIGDYTTEILFTSKGVNLGQDAYFLGFPYGLTSSGVPFLPWSSPLVKKCAISGLMPKIENRPIGFYLDGHNNPGFSGGPCCVQTTDGKWQVFAVVSSYLRQREMLYDERGTERMVLFENSGIFHAHLVDRLLDILP